MNEGEEARPSDPRVPHQDRAFWSCATNTKYSIRFHRGQVRKLLWDDLQDISPYPVKPVRRMPQGLTVPARVPLLHKSAFGAAPIFEVEQIRVRAV
jgi:hypothetical protein